MLGTGKAFEPTLAQWVDGYDRRSPPGAFTQFSEHARVVRRRVLAEDQDGIGVLEVVEQHGSLAYADGGRQATARRLVTHVRAIREVVRAIHPHEQLVDERCLVACTARGVERGLVRIVEILQV